MLFNFEIMMVSLSRTYFIKSYMFYETYCIKRFFRQEYWSGLSCLSPGDLPNPGIEPTSPVSQALQAGSLSLNHQGSPLESPAMCQHTACIFPLSL